MALKTISARRSRHAQEFQKRTEPDRDLSITRIGLWQAAVELAGQGEAVFPLECHQPGLPVVRIGGEDGISPKLDPAADHGARAAGASRISTAAPPVPAINRAALPVTSRLRREGITISINIDVYIYGDASPEGQVALA